MSYIGMVFRIDSADSLRSPWLEILVALLLFVSTLTVIGRPGVSSYVLVTHYLGTLRLISILYMAMLAGSLASALENGYAATLLQVPFPRRIVAGGLLLSRVLAPLLILGGASAAGFAALFWDMLGIITGPAFTNYLFTMIELIGYGALFQLLALATRSSSRTVLLSLLAYLSIGMGGEALVFMGLALSSRTAVMLGLLGNPAEAAGIYFGYVEPGVISGSDALISLAIGVSCIAGILVFMPFYLERWFEA